MASQRLAEYRNQLSADERARYDLEQELVKSKNELSLLSTTQVSLTKPKPHVLEHLPTPMARTVFGTEDSFPPARPPPHLCAVGRNDRAAQGRCSQSVEQAPR